MEHWDQVEQWRERTTGRWNTAGSSLEVGSIAEGRVISVHPFGVFMVVEEKILALLEVPFMLEASRRPLTIEEYPQVGRVLKVRIVDVLEERGELRVEEVSA